ncbi:hypothetical protein COCON_G00044380 [Conger conger]|uniref:Alpha-2,8-sialyltransferase 8E-like n=1 Tax=Conger conger TaxID=82655 RepID=A0A9Q1DUM7_CONCO|nr:hypothetical protein COCON_G00044380 [Conger conger]
MEKLRFFILICWFCTLFMTWKTYDFQLWDSVREENLENSVVRLQQCTRLREKYASLKVLKLRNTKEFTDNMRQLMSCPWTSNITQKERYRVELYYSCNATEELVLTKQNTALGQKITYEAEKATRVVGNSLLQMFPEITPWRTGGQLGRCAVVGNGGILKNSSCGSDINMADFVIRLNLAPINFSTDVGVKTNMMTANPTQIQRGYPNLKKQPQPLADKLSRYGNAPLIMPAFAFRFCTAIAFGVHQALRPFYPQQKVVFFNPNYLRNLHRYWRQRGQRAPRLSSGLMLASVALELCDEVHLYGFWPFNFDLSQKQLSHHYYDNVGPHRGLHSMPQEFLQLLNMHGNGAINLHIGKCQ